MNPLFKSFNALLVFSTCLLSCDREKEIIPAYLHITGFTLSTNPVTEGLNTSDIVSAKVFVNGAEIGNFELPATLPVMASGTCKVEIFPNVKENASSNAQKYFKPYNAYIETVVLSPGEIDSIRPGTTYRSNTTFKWTEDFEDQAISLTKSGANNTGDSLIYIPTSTPGVDQPFAGSAYCGLIRVSTDSFAVFERSTLSAFSDLPFLGTDVYVEMDIKSNVNFQVGVYTYPVTGADQNPVLVVNATGGQWKKIYVNLKPQIGDLAAGTPVRLFFGFYKEGGDTEDKLVYLDNLKLVYVN